MTFRKTRLHVRYERRFAAQRNHFVEHDSIWLMQDRNMLNKELKIELRMRLLMRKFSWFLASDRECWVDKIIYCQYYETNCKTLIISRKKNWSFSIFHLASYMYFSKIIAQNHDFTIEKWYENFSLTVSQVWFTSNFCSNHRFVIIWRYWKKWLLRECDFDSNFTKKFWFAFFVIDVSSDVRCLSSCFFD